MDNGFNGIPLAVFTGTAPSGTAAIVLLAVLLLTRRGIDADRATAAKRFLAVPLAVAWFGFIASATHLGTPANALYAFSNVGSSPLSNEVTAAIVFLFVAGVYWLASFWPKTSDLVDALGLVVCIVSGVALLAFTSVAYDVPTVPTWSTWHAPASVVLAGVCGGFSIAVLVVSLAGAATRRARYAMLGCAAVALVACAGVLASYIGFLGTVGNNVVEPGAHLATYPVAVPVFVALAVVGLGLQAVTVRLPMYGARRAALCGIGCALVLLAAVIVRMPFYEAYLSIGF